MRGGGAEGGKIPERERGQAEGETDCSCLCVDSLRCVETTEKGNEGLFPFTPGVEISATLELERLFG